MTVTCEQILDEAARILARPESWCQRTLQSGSRHCALGAIKLAYMNHGRSYIDWDSPAAGVLNTVVGELFPEMAVDRWGSLNCIPEWNDTPGRQHSEIVEALEKARAYAAEKGL